MASLVERLLQVAATSLSQRPTSSAVRRRAISTAYYAVFHAIAKTCADELLGGARHESTEYIRIYRALEHNTLRKVFEGKKGLLGQSAALRAIGEATNQLQGARMKADYMPPIRNLFSRVDTTEWIELARDTVRSLHRLQSDERRVLAVHLLFRDRGANEFR
jgi:hypothetical protein